MKSYVGGNRQIIRGLERIVAGSKRYRKNSKPCGNDLKPCGNELKPHGKIGYLHSQLISQVLAEGHFYVEMTQSHMEMTRSSMGMSQRRMSASEYESAPARSDIGTNKTHTSAHGSESGLERTLWSTNQRRIGSLRIRLTERFGVD